ncbi:MAG: GNAT family N-acetyltransferase [Candidatus Aenigmatarchaeota archaeon]
MAKLTFATLTLENFEKFKEYILRGEEEFPESIRSDENDYMEILTSPNPIAFVVFYDGIYIGNIVAHELLGEDLEICRNYISPNKKALYVYNFLVERGYRNNGYGYAIFKELIIRAKERGFEIIVAHCRKNEALHIFKKLGGIERKTFENWEDTKEDFILCEMDITKFSEDNLSSSKNLINNLNNIRKETLDVNFNSLENHTILKN